MGADRIVSSGSDDAVQSSAPSVSSVSSVSEGYEGGINREDWCPVESGGQRRRRLEALPARAEDEILRMQNVKLKKELSKCKLENEAWRLRERARRKKRRWDEESGAIAKRWRSNEGVVCTTLAEVVLKEVPETPEMCSSDGERTFDGVDPVVGGLVSDCSHVECQAIGERQGSEGDRWWRG